MTAYYHAECKRLLAAFRSAVKEWNAECHDGDTLSSDYVDGWNDAIADHAVPLADQVEAACARMMASLPVSDLTAVQQRIAELEAIVQQTQGVHVSWVERDSQARKRIAELEGDLAARPDPGPPSGCRARGIGGLK